MPKYNGFSSVSGSIDTRLSDMELVKQDLRNHLSIRQGEVRGVPTFGTRILDMIGQPLTDFTKQIVLNDVKAVIEYDPRVELKEIQIDGDMNSITIKARIYYTEFDEEDLFEYFADVRNSL